MRTVLLDENMPRQLAGPLRRAGYEVSTVEEAGLKGFGNGELLRAAEGRFDVLLTADRNVYAQQNLRGRRIAIVVLPTNRRRPVLERAADIVATVLAAGPGRYVQIAGDGTRTARTHDQPDGSPAGLPPVLPFGDAGGSGA